VRIALKVQRYNPEADSRPHWETYWVEVTPQTPLLDALNQVKEEQDGSLAFRRSCRGSICGSCAMRINGRAGLACNQLFAALGVKNGDTVTVEPLANLPIIKDLVVDMTDFWAKRQAIHPWLITMEEPPPSRRENIVPAAAQQPIFDVKAEICIMCASCYSDCPVVGLDRHYLGPTALLNAYRFNADPRDSGEPQRQHALDDEHGLWRCHTIFNCIEVCPKGVAVTKAIEQLKRRTVLRRLHLLPRDRA